MPRLRDAHDLDPNANRAADRAMPAGKSARTDDLAVQRTLAPGATPPQLQFAPARQNDDPFGLHIGASAAPVQMKGNGKAKREEKSEDLIGGLTNTERGKLQVVTAGSDKTPPLLFDESTITDLFPSEDGITNEPQAANVSIKLAPNIDASLTDGIENIVSRLYMSGDKPLRKNSTMTMLVDLRPVGGPLGTFRFTYVDRPDVRRKKGKDEILVELVATGGNDAITKDMAKTGKEKFKNHSLTFEGYSKAETESLCHAVALVPDGALSKIDGAKFRRASKHPTNPNVGGQYDEANHTVTMFDKAFVLQVNLAGTEVDRDMRDVGARNVAEDGTRSDESVRLIAHEIGHAIDYVPVRDGTSSKRSSEAHSRATGEFQDAVAADGGKRLTDYAETGWGEQYAEAFSFYVADPKLLEQLRPHVFAYFQKQFAAP
jgi:hypothetical protein